MQERLHQAHDTLIPDSMPHPVHEGRVVDLVEGVGDTLPTSGTFRKRCASCDPTIPSRARISSS